VHFSRSQSGAESIVEPAPLRDNAMVSTGHYENFPVASVLCPPHLRSTILAIYRYARAADDIADEGADDRTTRARKLSAYRHDLDAIFAGRPASRQWPEIFRPLEIAIRTHGLPHEPLADLLSAFTQDIDNPSYPDRDALVDYCRRSANPIGRLLLHLHRVDNPARLAQSDHLCTALQLINFWQDLSVDLPRGRVYLPLADAHRHGVSLEDPSRLIDSASTRRLVACLCDWAGAEMRRGAPLALALPGRTGWEARLVVQGGLRVLDKIRASGFATVGMRPTLGVRDLPRMLWRGLRMRLSSDAGFA